jgi:hypothetical protein
VNHPFFHALVFLLGVIVVLVRHVKADDSLAALRAAQQYSAPQLLLAAAADGVGSHVPWSV